MEYCIEKCIFTGFRTAQVGTRFTETTAPLWYAALCPSQLFCMATWSSARLLKLRSYYAPGCSACEIYSWSQCCTWSTMAFNSRLSARGYAKIPICLGACNGKLCEWTNDCVLTLIHFRARHTDIPRLRLLQRNRLFSACFTMQDDESKSISLGAASVLKIFLCYSRWSD